MTLFLDISSRLAKQTLIITHTTFIETFFYKFDDQMYMLSTYLCCNEVKTLNIGKLRFFNDIHQIICKPFTRLLI